MRKVISISVPVVFLSAAAFIFALPVIVTFTNSFMGSAELSESITSRTLVLMPREISLAQYYDLLIEKPKYISMFWNSVLLSVSITVFHTALSIIMAFVFAKLEFKFKNLLFFIYIIVMMMPFQVTLLPMNIPTEKCMLFGN